MLFAIGIYLFFSTIKYWPFFFISCSNSMIHYRYDNLIKQGQKTGRVWLLCKHLCISPKLNMFTFYALISFLREPQSSVPGACCYQSSWCKWQRSWVCIRAWSLFMWEWEAWTSKYLDVFMLCTLVCENGVQFLPAILPFFPKYVAICLR